MTQSGNTPLTARSVLASALLGADPPDLPVAHLVRLAGLFGLSENSARVALSRMVATGEAVTDGTGRYRIAGRLEQRRHRQEESLVGTTGNWDGTWHLVVVTAPGRAPEARQRRRKALTFARLGELREGTWLRPANLALALPEELSDDLTRFSARSEEPGMLAARLWDLEGWQAQAQVLLEELRRRLPSGPSDLAPGFVLSAAVLRHLQHDPLLPEALTPGRWPGADLRRAYARWDRAYRAVLTDWGRKGA